MNDIESLSNKNRSALMSKLHRLSAQKTKTLDVESQQNGQPTLHQDKEQLFATALKKHTAEFIELNNIEQLPATISRWLAEHAWGKTLYSGTNEKLNQLNWQAAGIELSTEAFSDDGQTSIATAECGVAETGTVVLTSSNQNPTANNFLARQQFIVLSKAQLFSYSEEAWEYLRNTFDPLPRTINFISGPSSSGDVGLKIEFGAHGPKTLVVVLID